VNEQFVPRRVNIGDTIVVPLKMQTGRSDCPFEEL